MPTDRTVTWAEVGIGWMIRGPSGRLRTVTSRSADGRTLVLDHSLTIAPAPADRITVVEPTELEALAAIFAAFPASEIVEG